jgi:hypothetical protein
LVLASLRAATDPIVLDGLPIAYEITNLGDLLAIIG